MEEQKRELNIGAIIIDMQAMLMTVISTQAEILSRLDNKPDATEWTKKLWDKVDELKMKLFEGLPPLQ